MNLNRATIIGNLTRDPEVKTTPTGQTVCSFGVATNYSYTDKSGQKIDKAEFHNIVAWGKLADICGQFLGKGRKVYVEGRLATREWEGQDGAKRNRTEIICENMIMLDKGNGPSGAPARATATSAAATEAPANDNEIRVEDLPF